MFCLLPSGEQAREEKQLSVDRSQRKFDDFGIQKGRRTQLHEFLDQPTNLEVTGGAKRVL